MIGFDEQNRLDNRVTRSIPYEQYFKPMLISDEQKKERIAFAEKMEEALVFILSLIEITEVFDNYTRVVLMNSFYDRFIKICKEFDIADDVMTLYMLEASQKLINTTIERREEEYYLSMDRAMFIAENEANTVLNYKDFVKAKQQGKTKKQWLDMKDNKERKTHLRVGGKVIGIDQSFKVGNSEMMYPKDTSLGADDKEIVNCRCSVKYF